MKYKIIYFGYRSWAKNVYNKIKDTDKCEIIKYVDNFEKYKIIESDIINGNIKFDILLFVGWSWIIPKDVVEKNLCIGVHPSDLPKYRGGSPIQNQIINGISKTKNSLITLVDNKIDSGDIWCKSELSLEGDNMSQILNNLTESTIILINYFMENYPEIETEKQNLSKGSYYERRKEKDSIILPEELKDLRQVYNKIRCLTDPYPNAYLEDQKGNKIFITGVKFKPKIN